jgi:hypothetical protein
MTLQYKAIPDNFELANVLLEMGEEYFQLGIDMLVRLKKHEDIFLLLLGLDKFTEALVYLKRFRIDLTTLTSEQKNLIKQKICSSSNKDILIDFLKG